MDDIKRRLIDMGFTTRRHKYGLAYTTNRKEITFSSNDYFVLITDEVVFNGFTTNDDDFNKLDQYIKLMKRSHTIKKVLNNG